MITLDILTSLFPNTKEETLESFVGPLNAACDAHEINTRERVAAFLAQTGHESGGLRIIKENLNYSADGLLRVFSKYFSTREAAEAYARKPEKIGNRVYANRMGNGDERSGDGYRYCGRGLIQLTGKDNYSRFAKSQGISLDAAVALLETVDGAVASAAWFWSTNKLNTLADRGDITAMTKKINGGTNGLAERTDLYEQALELL